MRLTGLLLLTAGLSAFAMDRPQLPYTFEENQGQAPAPVKYLARGQGYSLFLTDREAVLALERDANTRQIVRMSLDGSQPASSIQGVGRAQQTTNYLVGNEPVKWKTNVPHFNGVRYANVYQGIDLVYHSAASQLEYDFVVAPGARTADIQMRFGGVQTMRVTMSGALELQFGARKLVNQAPVAYQEIGGRRRLVRASYNLLGDNRVGFRVGPHNEALPLVIDPVVLYATFLGGDRTDSVSAIAVDPQGNTYVTGETTSANFPAVGTAITQIQGAIPYAFVTKYNAAGTQILYSTLLGGNSNTRGQGIAVDAAGNAYVSGVTGAKNFPMVNPVQATHPGLNIGYVAKLNPQGNAILFSTYIGGERNDEARSIAVDSAGAIHVTGRVTSTTFPTSNAIQPTFGGNTDAFVAVYSAPNYRLKFSTLLGKTGLEEANALTVDAQGATYVTGFAAAAGMATAGAYQSLVRSPNDAFALKINAEGTSLDWFTYYGGRGDEYGKAIALDTFGNVLIGGSATSDNLVTTSNAIQPALRGDNDAFLAKFSADGRDLLYATYLGSATTRSGISESINGIGVDPTRGVALAGITDGANFPTVRPIQPFGGGTADGFVARLNPSLADLDFSTHVGGSLNEEVLGMALDGNGGIHLAGYTLSTNFPLKNAINTAFGSAQEGFVSHICDPFLISSQTALEFRYEIGKTVPVAQSVQLSACAPILFTTQVTGTFFTATPGNGITNGTATIAVQPQNLEPGTYAGDLRVSAPDAVNSPISIRVILKVIGPPPAISANGIVHAATAQTGAISPGELLVIYGQNLGAPGLSLSELNAQNRMASTLKDTRVLFDDVPGPMVYTSAGQLSTIAPYSISGKATVRVEVEYQGVRSAPVTMAVTPTAPGIFTANASGTGQGSILNQDYGVNGAGNPAERGAVILIYATGEGQTNPGGGDGQLANEVLAHPTAPVTVTIGGVNAEVAYAGSAPGLVAGVLQINAFVPRGIPVGNAEVLVKVGSATSRTGVTVAVK
ncbi:MAG: SBBP repeat-containing protein [Bryobacteraceae bacterium]